MSSVRSARTIQFDHDTSRPIDHDATPSILVCILGDFLVLKSGRPVGLRSSGKSEALLCHLALQHRHHIHRDTILQELWPDSNTTLATQSLNSLIYTLRKTLGDHISGAAPIVNVDGYYRLNTEAGVGVDVACFDAEADAGDRYSRAGSSLPALAAYRRAVSLYRGDLCVARDVHSIIERERLRVRYLGIRAYLADHHYGAGDYAACLDYTARLLNSDPCREDAHRLVIRCYVRLGQRAQALRQYRLCQDLLRREFDAVPEPATTLLFDQVRLDPNSI